MTEWSESNKMNVNCKKTEEVILGQSAKSQRRHSW